VQGVDVAQIHRIGNLERFTQSIESWLRLIDLTSVGRRGWVRLACSTAALGSFRQTDG
jgi:hypothetical protein